MTTDFRNLITRMAEELDDYRQLLLDDRTVTHRLSDEARAALADKPAVPEGREPVAVTGQPSDEELESFLVDVAANHGDIYWAEPLVLARAVLARWGNYPGSPDSSPPADGELLKLAQQYSVVYLCSDGSACNPFQDGYDMRGDLLAFARAVWALAGNPEPAPPADGEVAELVADHSAFASWLAQEMPPGTIIGDPYWWAPRIARRAAELLQRHVPVAVSERLPGVEDCDAEGRCWCFTPQENIESSLVFLARWLLSKPTSCDTHWLPAHALLLPEVNV